MTHALQSGVIPAPIMPFQENGAIDWTTLDRYVAQMAGSGISALALNMAAAEATAMSHAEQVETLQRSRKVLAGQVPLVSGLIAGHTAGAVDHARRLVDAGAEGLVVFPPLPTFMSKPLPVSVVAE